MGAKSSHAAGERVRKRASRRGPARRVASLLTVALASAVVVTAAAVASAKPASLRVTALNRSGTPRPVQSLPASKATAQRHAEHLGSHGTPPPRRHRAGRGRPPVRGRQPR